MAVLATSKIMERLNAGEIFTPGSYDPRNLWGVKYDLRMGTDFMVVPDPAFPPGRRYRRGTKRDDAVVLDPGRVAFVSTAEKFRMPWDLVGNIGPKFAMARKGIVVLTGFVVDPGFGLREISPEKWVPKDDERLHFLLANLSREQHALVPGVEKIACIQFLEVSGELERREITSTDELEQEFFTEPYRAGLIVLQQLEEAREETKTRVEDFETKLHIVQTSTNTVVLFGVYLFLVTLLAASVAVLLTIIENGTASSSAEEASSVWGGWVLIVAVSLLGGLVAAGSVLGIVEWRRSRLGRPAGSR